MLSAERILENMETDLQKQSFMLSYYKKILKEKRQLTIRKTVLEIADQEISKIRMKVCREEKYLNQKHSLDAADCSLLQIIRLIQLLIGDEHTGKSKEVTMKDRNT